DLQGLRRVLRALLAHYLGARGLKSWELMGELGRIAAPARTQASSETGADDSVSCATRANSASACADPGACCNPATAEARAVAPTKPQLARSRCSAARMASTSPACAASCTLSQAAGSSATNSLRNPSTCARSPLSAASAL